MPDNPIAVYMPSGEAREGKMRAAIEADKQGRFRWGGNASDLPGDVRFCLHIECENFAKDAHCEPCDRGPCIRDYRLDVEIKDFTGEGNSDYLSSVLNGHLWDQVTRTEGPYVIVVLGDDHDIQAAIRKAAGHGEKGKRVAPGTETFDLDKFRQYSALVDELEANCEGEHIRIYKLGYNQFPRLLLRARKILEGGNLSGFAPHPMPGERQAAALSILAGDGIGPAKALQILDKFRLVLIGRDAPGLGIMSPRRYNLMDCDGIGPKLAKRIRENIEVVD